MFELAKFLNTVYDTESTRPDNVALELLSKMGVKDRKELIMLCRDLENQIRATLPSEEKEIRQDVIKSLVELGVELQGGSKP